MNWYLKVLKQYVDFSGRARRKEFWMFTLFNMIIYIALMLIMIAGITSQNDSLTGIGIILFIAYDLAIIIPHLAVCVRRLHDVGRSGWYYFILFVPLVGFIILLVWFCTDSQAGENEWGANPKE